MSILLVTAVAACLAAIFVYLHFSFFKRERRDATRAAVAKVPEGRRGDTQTCPLCAALLASGEVVNSKVFPPSGRADRLLHISGCKHCLSGERERFCPVCDRPVSVDDYLVARIWQQQDKIQVQVQGCVKCLVGKGRARAVRLR